jgi:hypothetical protein
MPATLRMMSLGDVHPLSDPVSFTPITCSDRNTNEPQNYPLIYVKGSHDRRVGIATGYGLDTWFRSWHHRSIQTDSGTHPVSYPVATRDFPPSGAKLKTHLIYVRFEVSFPLAFLPVVYTHSPSPPFTPHAVNKATTIKYRLPYLRALQLPGNVRHNVHSISTTYTNT